MNIKYKNYAITHDGLNYVVNKVSHSSAERAKAENVGKEYLRPLKYYRTLKSALKSIRDMVIADELQDVADLDRVIGCIEQVDWEFYEVLKRVKL